MRRTLAILALFTATWTGPGAALIRWDGGAALTCLYKGATLIRCWAGLGDGPHALRLGGTGPLDAKAHVSAQDVFTLVQDDRESRAPLRYAVWVASVTKPPAQGGRLFVPWAGRG